MPDFEYRIDSNNLHERTMVGVRQVIDRGLSHINGFEKAVVARAVNVLYPRLEQRIRKGSEEQLRAELEYLHRLLVDVLADKPEAPQAASVKSKAQKRPRARKPVN